MLRQIGARFADAQEWRTWDPPDDVPFEEDRGDDTRILDEADLEEMGIEYSAVDGRHMVRFDAHTEVGGRGFPPGTWHPLIAGATIDIGGRKIRFDPSIAF